jgi:hypothetical protein
MATGNWKKLIALINRCTYAETEVPNTKEMLSFMYCGVFLCSVGVVFHVGPSSSS